MCDIIMRSSLVLSFPPPQKIPPFTFPKTSSDPINLNVESFLGQGTFRGFL